MVAGEDGRGGSFVPSAVGSAEAMVAHGDTAVVEGFGDRGGVGGDRSRGVDGGIGGGRGVKCRCCVRPRLWCLYT